MKATGLLVCLVIQFCVVPSLLLYPIVPQESKFPPRLDVETKLDLHLERNVPKVTLE